MLSGLGVAALYIRANWDLFIPVASSIQFAFQLMLAGTVIAVLRNEAGVSTFGVFGPAILAFAWLEVGPLWGFLLVAYVFVVTASARASLRGLDMGTPHRVATLLVVAGIALFVMEAAGRLQGIPTFETALLFPVVLTTWYAERFVTSVAEDGWQPGSRRLAWTLIAITAAYLVAGYEPLVDAFVRTPEAWVGVAALNVFLGGATNIRLTEYLRFRTLRRSLGAERDGVLTMRVRNRDFISEYNPAGLMSTLDKVRVKRLCHGLEIPTPETFLLVDGRSDLDDLRALLAERESFVIKPVGGSGGRGVLVVRGRAENGDFETNRGQLPPEAVVSHARDIVYGGDADYGAWDRAIVEAVVHPDGILANRAVGGVPDLRVIVFQGHPIMAMARLPTEESNGTANIHTGAVGVAVDVASGEASGGFQQTRSRFLDSHPDTGASLSFTVPDWEETLTVAARAATATGLGYAGVDIVFDAERGPLVLEVNRRPGLGIQNANMAGLLGRLRFVEDTAGGGFESAAARVEQAVAWHQADWSAANVDVPPVTAATVEVER